ESALGGFDFLARDFRSSLMGLKFLQPGDDYLREVALLVTVGNFDGFIELAFAQRAGDCRSEQAALFAGTLERHVAVDHNADGPRRHEEQDNDDRFRRLTHVGPEVDEIELRRASLLQ